MQYYIIMKSINGLIRTMCFIKTLTNERSSCILTVHLAIQGGIMLTDFISTSESTFVPLYTEYKCIVHVSSLGMFFPPLFYSFPG